MIHEIIALMLMFLALISVPDYTFDLIYTLVVHNGKTDILL